MNVILKFKLDENGLAASMPFLALFIFSAIYGRFADYLIVKNKMSITHVRKLSTMIASIGPAGCFTIIIFISEKDKIKVVALMVLSMVFFSATFAGILQVHMDIAPNFAGTLVSLTNTFASIPGIAIPLFVGWITERDVPNSVADVNRYIRNKYNIFLAYGSRLANSFSDYYWHLSPSICSVFDICQIHGVRVEYCPRTSGIRRNKIRIIFLHPNDSKYIKGYCFLSNKIIKNK